MQPLIFILTFSFAVAMLSSLSKPLYEKVIEKDLSQKVDSVTSKHFNPKTEDEASQPSFTLRGQQLTVDVAHLPEAKTDTYLEELDSIFGVYLVENDRVDESSTVSQVKAPTSKVEAESQITSSLTPTIDPPLLNSPSINITENYRAGTVTISGEIASANEKQQLIDALTKESQLTLKDELTVSNMVTTIRQRELLFQLCADFLSNTENSSIEWSPEQIKIAGEMNSNQAIADIRERFDSLAAGEQKIIATNLYLIKPPSLDFTLERLSNNTIILKGTLPNKAMGDTIYELVAKSHTASIGVNNKSYIANNLRYADQELEAWWIGVPETFIGDFLKQTEGIAKIEYSDSGLYIEGVYKSQDEFIRARSSFQAIPQHLDIYDDFLRVKGEKLEDKTPPLNQTEIEVISSLYTAHH